MNICLDCNKDFKYKSLLERHKNRKTPCVKKNEIIIKEYNCETCNKTFTSNYKLNRHKNNKVSCTTQIINNNSNSHNTINLPYSNIFNITVTDKMIEENTVSKYFKSFLEIPQMLQHEKVILFYFLKLNLYKFNFF